MTERTNCVCMSPPVLFDQFEVEPPQYEDDQHGGEISVQKCKHCGTKWLVYFVEYPAFTASGRWCRGVVQDIELEKITSTNAINFLEQLPWYIYGGSYFKSPGLIGKGHFRVIP